MSKQNQIPTTNTEEIETLIEKLKHGDLDQTDTLLIERILRTFLTLVSLLQKKNQSISKLKRMLFGPKSDTRSIPTDNANTTEEGLAEESKQRESGTTTKVESKTQSDQTEEKESTEGEKKKRKGHGRRAREEYVGAEVVSCPHTEYKAGSRCPESLCKGHLFDTKDPSVLIQLEGQPPVSATCYEQQVLRCSACQKRFTADLSKNVEPMKYHPSCDVAIAMWKYFAGMPFYRLRKVESCFGIPLSESVMFERCENVADALLPVYLYLRRMAAQGKVLYLDDTKVKILSLIEENKKLSPDQRRGMQTSGIISEVGDKKIAIYASGRKHSGENITELIKEREIGLSVPVQMGDPLAANWTGEYEREEVNCLAHARRQFTDIEKNRQRECKVALDAIAQVYKFESETKGMSSSERLVYHQGNSGPVMQELKEWMEKQIREKRVEPNDSLCGAYSYMLKRWDKLTQFLRLEGCPIDNNQAERALKLVVLNRKNSLFYKTEHGADVGDILMSIMKTCELNGVRAWDYLLELMKNRKRLKREPEDWLPWNYHLKLENVGPGELESAQPLAA